MRLSAAARFLLWISTSLGDTRFLARDALLSCLSNDPSQEMDMTVTLQDISCLRKAARKSGADAIPAAIVARLIGARLIEADPRTSIMRITTKGQIALTKLG